MLTALPVQPQSNVAIEPKPLSQDQRSRCTEGTPQQFQREQQPPVTEMERLLLRDNRPGEPGGVKPRESTETIYRRDALSSSAGATQGPRDPRPGNPRPRESSVTTCRRDALSPSARDTPGPRDPRSGDPRPREPVAETVYHGATAGNEDQKKKPRYKLSELPQVYRTRPASAVDKTGSGGRAMTLATNHVKVKSTPNWLIYHYHVKFEPEIENKRWRKELMSDHVAAFGGRNFLFDGMGLYMVDPLEENLYFYSSHPGDPNEKVHIKVELTETESPDSAVAVHLYNLLFRSGLAALNMQQVGRYYYSMNNGISIPQHKLQIMPGFVSSILPYENEVLLQVDVCHKILSQETILELMDNLYKRFGDDNRDFHAACLKKLLGQIVMTTYNNKTYRISDISWNEHPSSEFETNDGPITFAEYYKKQYNFHDLAPYQPLLVSLPKARDIRRGVTKPIKLIPELCVLTGLSEETRADFNVMRDLSSHSRVGPADRLHRYNSFLKKINTNPVVSNNFSKWDLEIDDKVLEIPARQLQKIDILMSDGGQPMKQKKMSLRYDQGVCDWSQGMREKSPLNKVPLNQWILVFPVYHRSKMENFVRTLMSVCGSMKIAVNAPRIIPLTQNEKESAYLSAFRQNCLKGDQMVIAILSNNNKARYDAIKKYLCVENPIPSQCVLAKTLGKQKQLMSITTKIAIQMQCKLGGEIWACKFPRVSKPYMIVGIDTYHDSSEKGKSACGFVASMNQNTTRYFSSVSFQTAKVELCNGLEVFMTAAIHKFHEINHIMPELIFVYRDGVGDGQLPAVFTTEVESIRRCFSSIGESYTPQMTFIVVKKRINQRFFDWDEKPTNPPPGTVIDQEVTKPEWYDFFLISQSVKQGTVSPTHYNIIHDTIEWGPTKMQIWTYMQTHLYYNWPGTICVPAPCQYAHKLAFLTGQSLHKAPSPVLTNTLFYL